MNKINVGVIGMGIGEKHAIAYQKHSKCVVKSICDFDVKKKPSIIKNFPTTFKVEEEGGEVNNYYTYEVEIINWPNE